MNTILLFVIFSLLLMHQIYALRCRSGNQPVNDEFRKVMQKCKQRHSESDRMNDDDSSSSDDESSEENSAFDETVFESNFFTGSKNNNRQKNDSRSMGRETSNQNHRFEQNNKNSWSPSSSSNPSSNSRMGSNQMSNRNSGSYDSRQGNRDMQSDNNQRNFEDSDKQDCSTHCFFNELNLVNQRGYPEREAVIGTMLRGIQDPILRDFIEESIIECFQFLSSVMNLDKCKFSRNLVTCFAEKGKERCEDWDD